MAQVQPWTMPWRRFPVPSDMLSTQALRLRTWMGEAPPGRQTAVLTIRSIPIPASRPRHFKCAICLVRMSV